MRRFVKNMTFFLLGYGLGWWVRETVDAYDAD